jgi:hypothetical protein
MMSAYDNVSAGALVGGERIISECLSVAAGQSVAVFWDETTGEVFQALELAASRLGIKVHSCKVDLTTEFAFRHGDEFPSEYTGALGRSRATISCLTDDPRGTNFRKAVIENGLRDSQSRVAHMPGATAGLLENGAAIEYAEAGHLCDYLGAVFALGEDAVLETYILDPHQKCATASHRLRLALGGTSRLPITSPGTIGPGTWGNVPGGETFIAPQEGSAEGAFVLNGAFTGHVLEHPAFLILHFKAGRLMDVEGDQSAKEKFQALLSGAEEGGDPHCKDLAELGVGVNRGVRRLTGRSLFDEKLYGTAHIAIGDSRNFGGHHTSDIHEDFVTLRPSLSVDGSPVLVHGRLVFDYDRWHDRLDVGEAGATAALISDLGTARVYRTMISTSVSESGVFHVDHEIGAQRNRRCTYTVGAPDANSVLGRLYAILPESHERNVTLDSLLKKAIAQGIDERMVRRALYILRRHHLAEFS